jgi:hypothetical protein
MLSEVDIGGVFVAPIAIYGFVAAFLTTILRFVLVRSGLLRLTWHPALLEVSLFASILSLLVLLA